MGSTKAYTITNIVANSGFTGSSGSWPPDWASNTAATYVSSSSGILAFTTTSSYGGTLNTALDYTLGDKLYCRAAVRKGAAGADVKFALVLFYQNTTWKEQHSVVESANTDREVGTAIITVSTTGVNKMRFGSQNNTSGKTVYLDSPVIVNLTSVFGAGKEPDKTWCDANIPYFSGTMTVYK